MLAARRFNLWQGLPLDPIERQTRVDAMHRSIKPLKRGAWTKRTRHGLCAHTMNRRVRESPNKFVECSSCFLGIGKSIVVQAPCRQHVLLEWT